MNCNICKSLRIDGATGYAEPVCLCNWRSGGTTYITPKQETEVSKTKFELIERLGLQLQTLISRPGDEYVRADELEALLQTFEKYTEDGTGAEYITMQIKPADQRVSRSEIERATSTQGTIDISYIELQKLLERILKHGIKDEN